MKYKCKLKTCWERVKKENLVFMNPTTYFCSKKCMRSYNAELNRKTKEKEKKKRLTARENIPALTRKLDKIVSEYIRLRDTDKKGYGKCCTCDNILHWKESHCCHFIGRGNKKYRWDEQNLKMWCPACNTYHQQMHQQKFTLLLIDEIGKKKVEEMLNDTWIHKVWKIELKQKIDFWQVKLESERLKKEL